MLPPSVFGIRTFAVGCLLTLVVYAGLFAMGFVLTVALQRGLGYSALRAGAATVPVTLVLLGLSAPVGALLPAVGARVLLTAGPVLMAAGLLMLSRLGPGASYAAGVLPGLLVFAAGLVLVVSPVTTTTLDDVPGPRQGVASGTSNAVARIGGLLAIAALPLVSGLAAADQTDAAAVLEGATGALVWSAGLCLLGAGVALAGLRRREGRTAG